MGGRLERLVKYNKSKDGFFEVKKLNLMLLLNLLKDKDLWNTVEQVEVGNK